uniref:Uncharacterized protein n=1 Tax=Leersia perrieri TaxID=77586 RepID=A0A0D9XZU2_9ORYZ
MSILQQAATCERRNQSQFTSSRTSQIKYYVKLQKLEVLYRKVLLSTTTSSSRPHTQTPLFLFSFDNIFFAFSSSFFTVACICHPPELPLVLLPRSHSPPPPRALQSRGERGREKQSERERASSCAGGAAAGERRLARGEIGVAGRIQETGGGFAGGEEGDEPGAVAGAAGFLHLDSRGCWIMA